MADAVAVHVRFPKYGQPDPSDPTKLINVPVMGGLIHETDATGLTIHCFAIGSRNKGVVLPVLGCTPTEDPMVYNAGDSFDYKEALAPAPELGGNIYFCIDKEEDGSPVLRPAKVVRDWNGDGSCLNVQVFLDGSNDSRAAFLSDAEKAAVAIGTMLIAWRTSVSEGNDVGCYYRELPEGYGVKSFDGVQTQPPPPTDEQPAPTDQAVS